ncbi:hypothetical protein H0178_31305 [Cytobacillus firmus]|nr:hypothetical protein [Cytobacillus firmus]
MLKQKPPLRSFGLMELAGIANTSIAVRKPFRFPAAFSRKDIHFWFSITCIDSRWPIGNS